MCGSWIKKNQKHLQIKYALITAVVANIGPILVSQPKAALTLTRRILKPVRKMRPVKHGTGLAVLNYWQVFIHSLVACLRKGRK